MRKITALLLGLVLAATAGAGYNPNNPNGQTTKANSQPVVLPSDWTLPAFTATPTFNIGTAPTFTVSGTFWPYTLGQTTMSGSVPVTLASNQSALAVTGSFWQPTQPVSGTFWQTTQPVSMATAPITPVTGTFWQATQPVSAAALPLPTGAATAALQPGFGTAGTANANVITVQGIAGATPQPVSGTVTANAGTGTMAVSMATAPSTPVTGTFWQATQPVSAAALPLPSNAAQETGGNLASLVINTTGLATASNQATAASTLSTIATNTGASATAASQTTGNASLATIATNSGVHTAADVVSTGNTIACGTLNTAYTVTNTTGIATESFSVAGLTACGGTLTIEASDDGSTYAAINGIAPSTGVLFSTLTTDQQFRVNAAARGKIRLRVSSAGSASNITVASIGSVAPGVQAIAAPVPLQAQVKVGSGTTVARTLRTGVTGSPDGAATYDVFTSGASYYSTPQDLFCITGSATKIVEIKAVGMLMQSTAATFSTFDWVKRTTLNSGGTPVTLTFKQRYSGDPAPTATATYWTSAPSLGTSGGILSTTYASTALLTAAPTNTALSTYMPNGNNGGTLENYTLANQNESICANWRGAALPSGFTSTIFVTISEFTAP